MLPVMTNDLFQQVSPAEVEAEDKKELVAEMEVDEEQWPPPDTSMHANSGQFRVLSAARRNTLRKYTHIETHTHMRLHTHMRRGGNGGRDIKAHTHTHVTTHTHI